MGCKLHGHVVFKYHQICTIYVLTVLVNKKLCFSGIANALDLTDRILPRLQARPNCKPELLNFAPYSKEQISAIIKDRLKDVCIYSGAEDVLVYRYFYFFLHKTFLHKTFLFI